ncbi:class I SAM-dependent methyltransferase [Chloroflexota bacterium]
MKSTGKANINHLVNYDKTYLQAFDQDIVGRSNLQANTAFLEDTALFNTPKTILEIGCGAGSLNNYLHKNLHKKGYRIIGTDISEEVLKKAASLYPWLTLQQMSAEKLKFEDKSFDMVLSFDVFEHIKAVEAHLSEVYRVLQAGGLYLFSTPNKYTNIPFSILKDKNFNFRYYHPSLQTLSSLKRLLKKHGFTASFTRQPIFNEFTRRKLEAIVGRYMYHAITLVNWQRVPLFIYPNFYVTAKVIK